MPITFTTAADGLAERATALANRVDAAVADLLAMLAELDALEVEVDQATLDAGLVDLEYREQIERLGLGSVCRARDGVTRLAAALDD